MKLKVITVVGTRPEIIRLSRIINKLDFHFNHILVHTGQNYNFELSNIFFKELKIKKPDFNLNCKSKNAIEFISRSLVRFDKILELEKPDAVLVLGDTNSALTVLCAKKRKIPIFHIEAGNRCFDESVPEEINRKIIDHIADINLTYSSYASSNLKSEGISQDRIIKVGSPLLEVYNFYDSQIENSNIIKKLNLKSGEYILASIHREENVDFKRNLQIILNAILVLQKKLKVPVIFSSHPRTKLRIKKFKLNLENKINFHKPFGFFDYAKLLKNSKIVLSDSGSLTEETSILSIPSINIRDSNERQEGMEYGTTIMTSVNADNIINAAEITLNKIKENKIFENNKIYPDYSEENVSDKIVNIIQSYTHYINKKVWFKF
jgi:UDP-N-acetylglucosamine 2-epimerase (non-hydrolysing)